MSTRIDGVQAAPAPRATRIQLAAAIGLALLVLGLAAGLLVGRLQAASDQRPVSAAAASLAPPGAELAALSWKDDYGTRHHLTPVKDPVLGWRDFLGTRHAQGPSKAPTLSWKDDYGTRHPNQRP
jgi:hypothetical protein